MDSFAYIEAKRAALLLPEPERAVELRRIKSARQLYLNRARRAKDAADYQAYLQRNADYRRTRYHVDPDYRAVRLAQR